MGIQWTKQQRQAIDEKGKNIIVSAGAGSGKTAVLSERVLEHIITDHFDVDKLLVLTFTNAAAASMKKKIRKTIAKSERLSDEERKRQLDKIDGAYIMTFDAYALALVKKYHYLLQVDTSIGVMDDVILKMKRDEVLSEIMNEHYASKEPSFTRLVEDFCVRNDNTIRENVIKIDRSLALMYDRDAFVASYDDCFYQDANVEAMFQAFEQEVVTYRTERIRKMLYQMSEYGSLETTYIGVDDLLHADGYEALRNAVNALEIKRFNRKNYGDEEEASELHKKIKDEYAKLLKTVVFDKKELIEQYKQTQDGVKVYLELAQELNRRMQAFKRSLNSYEFTDIFKMAIDIVEKYEPVRVEIRDYFQEIMVDEYQDTSDLQEIFLSKIENNNIYMVGDIKQSIYRFRNANPSIFKDKYDAYKHNEGGMAIDLLANFRSRKEVLSDINVMFDRLMCDRVGGAHYNPYHRMNNGNQDYNDVNKGAIDQNHHTEILTYTYDKKEYPFHLENVNVATFEAKVCALDMQKRIQNHEKVYVDGQVRDIAYRDFCILLDRKGDFDEYIAVFTEMGIPLRVDQQESMKQSDVLIVVKAIFQMLTCMSQRDYGSKFKSAYVSLARSFIGDSNDAEIYDVVTSKCYKQTPIFEKMKGMLDNIEQKSIYDLLEEAIERFEIYDAIRSIGDVQENVVKLNYLCKMAHSLNELAYTYRDFEEYLEHIFDKEEDVGFHMQKQDVNAVRLMTIHNSKGLEFTYCYFPSLYKGFNKQDINAKMAINRELGLIIPYFMPYRGQIDTFAKALFNIRAREEDISEKIRLFYVALTRAREKMILVCPLEYLDESSTSELVPIATRLDMNCFLDMLNVISNDLDEVHGMVLHEIELYDENGEPVIDFSGLGSKSVQGIFDLIDETNQKITIRHHVNIEPEEVMVSHFSKASGLVSEEIRKLMDFGTKMHYYMEIVDFMTPDYQGMDAMCAKRVQAFLQSDLMKDVANATAYKEYEFIFETEQESKHGFIDLLMEYEDRYEIIDYKLKNIDDALYDTQLNAYRDYIKTISDKPVKCYLYSLMDSTYREVLEQ